MADFRLQGNSNPALQIFLNQNETVFCEANAMMTMNSNLDLSAGLNDGFLASIGRAFLTQESFFRQKIQAKNGNGSILLAPQFSGGIELLDVGNEQFFIADSCYLASSENVKLSITNQKSLGSIIFGNNGGFFITETSGYGKLAVCGYGDLVVLDITPDTPMIVDNGHLVAWSKNLSQKTTISTRKNTNFFKQAVNSVLSSEGVLFEFSGQGKIILSTRNKLDYYRQIYSISHLK